MNPFSINIDINYFYSRRRLIGDYPSKNDDSVSHNNIKDKLFDIFKYYCQYGNKFNTTSLKSANYIKFCQDSGFLDNKIIDKTRLELIFAKCSIYTNENQIRIPKPSSIGRISIKTSSSSVGKGSKSIINFNEFLTCITKISEFYIENTCQSSLVSNKQQKLNKIYELILNRINPLYDHITIFSTKRINSQINYIAELDVDAEYITSCAFPFLIEFYKIYFKTEQSLTTNKEYIKEESMKNIFEFLKDFDICPGKLSKANCFDIIHHFIDTFNCKGIISILNSKLIPYLENNSLVFGMYLTIYHFILILVNIAEIAIIDSLNENLTLAEKLCLLFEKIELSPGFNNICQKTHKSLSKKIISYENIFNLTSQKVKNNKNERSKSDLNYSLDTKEFRYSVLQQNSLTITSSPFKSYKSTNEKSIFSYIEPKIIFENNNLMEITTKYYKELNTIFKYYCEFGDSSNTGLMSNFKFTKFLRDTKLIYIKEKNERIDNCYGINLLEIDLLYLKLTNIDAKSIVNKSILNDRSSTIIKDDEIFKSNCFNTSFKTSLRQNNTIFTSINSFNKKASPIKNLRSLSTNYNNPHIRTSSLTSSKDIGYKSIVGKEVVVTNSHKMLTFDQFLCGLEIIINKQNYTKKSNLSSTDNYINQFDEFYLSILSPIYKFIQEKRHSIGSGFITDKEENNIDLIVNIYKDNDEQFNSLVQKLHKVFWEIYINYIDKEGLYRISSSELCFSESNTKSLVMSFSGLFQFLQDFEIFPNLISKSKVIKFYKHINKNEEKTNIFAFVDVLCQIAFEIPYFKTEKPSPTFKVLHFLEKLSLSEGKKIIINNKGIMKSKSIEGFDLTKELKDDYWEYFKINDIEKEQNKPISFDDILFLK